MQKIPRINRKTQTKPQVHAEIIINRKDNPINTSKQQTNEN